MPPAGAEWRAQQRATLERLAHERSSTTASASCSRRRAAESTARRRTCSASRGATTRRRAASPGELVEEIAHAGATGHEAWTRARGPRTSRCSSRTCGATSSCAGATSRASPRPSGRTTPCSTTTSRDAHRRGRARPRRLRDGLVALVDEAAPRPDDDALLLGGRSRRRAAARSSRRSLRRSASRPPVAPGRRGAPVRAPSRSTTCGSPLATPRTTSTRSSRTLHEFGHGLYEATSTRRSRARRSARGVVERGPRVAEPAVGEHGRPQPRLLALVLPAPAERVPRALRRPHVEDVHRAVNVVRPTLIRVSADEVTYGLHVILRFELELALFEGGLDRGRPARRRGRERMRAYLGLEVPDDAHGVLQDVHWAEGLFGYFPTYALGDVISAQLWAPPRRRDPRPRRALRRAASSARSPSGCASTSTATGAA